MNRTDFFSRLDSAIEQYSLLNHPFYQAWSAGTLTRETLAEYAAQYYQFERSFPQYLSAAHSNAANPEHRKQLLLNLMEEEQGEPNHPELWLQFGEEVGCVRTRAMSTSPFPETKALMNYLSKKSRKSDTLEAVAALYGYESQIPEISRTKIEGLEHHYNVTSDKGLRFFRVHEEADVIHRQAERDLLAELALSPDDEERAIAAAEGTAKAFYAMLDGIVRECKVAC